MARRVVQSLPPILAKRPDLEFGDQHADEWLKRYGTGHDMKLVEVDVAPGPSVNPSIQGSGDMEMVMVWTRMLWTRLPVINQELSFVSIEESILVHLDRTSPTTL